MASDTVQISLPSPALDISDQLLSNAQQPNTAPCYKPIAPAMMKTPITFDRNSSSRVANKRMRNTESARRSRERKALRLAELEHLLEQSEKTRITLASELAMLQLQKKRNWDN
ncbi:hypothetical protein HK103_006344 [Boothiomyces macroporosus]|uniref:BZIP domain-containing protein n=1 Tax=Boothiomyces macroporosus TaxID=261099 RepID=A0AAD5UHU7_9FUNG|nr:hypothetical protein HK103_006344 [Boothiomyces macroporosus]